MPNIKLRSSDGETIEVDVEVAKCSNTMKTMVEDLGTNKDETKVVPIPNVKSAILKKILDWATYHKDHLQPLENDDDQDHSTDNISPWDVEFFNVDQDTLYELVVAANYLEIKGLLKVACQKVANLIKSKTAEEIRKMFYIKNDSTGPEEDEGDEGV